jgi:hypothetical protein
MAAGGHGTQKRPHTGSTGGFEKISSGTPFWFFLHGNLAFMINLRVKNTSVF